MKNAPILLISIVVLTSSFGTAALADELDPKTHCTREAREYEIQSELVQEYIENCILGMGGMPDGQANLAAEPAYAAPDTGQPSQEADVMPGQAVIEEMQLQDPEPRDIQYQPEPVDASGQSR